MFEYNAADAFSLRHTEGTSNFDIDEKLRAMALATGMQKRLIEINYKTPKRISIYVTQPTLPTLGCFISTYGKDTYKNIVQPTVKIYGASFHFGENSHLVK